MHKIPPATLALLAATVIGYGLQKLLGDWAIIHFALWPLGAHETVRTADGLVEIGFAPWQLVTYAFLHGGGVHLLFNAFALYMFGSPIEQLFGTRPFLVYYFACVLGAAAAQLVTLSLTLPPDALVPTVGASGGVFGLLLAFGMMFPRERIMLLFPPIPMPAWLFVIGYGLVELYLGLSGSRTGIAHFAHLGGMVAGIVLIQYWRGKLPVKPRRILTR